MRICVLSNSHAASLRLGWDLVAAELPDIELSFFASHKTSLGQLIPQDGRLIAKNDVLAEQLAFTSGGSREIDFARYDACLIYALYLIAPRLDARMSKAVQSAALHDAVAGSFAMSLCKMAREVTRIPFFVAHNPLRAVSPAAPGRIAGHMLPYAQILDRMAHEITVPDVSLLAQPAETILDGLYTREEYSVGSVRLEHVKRALDDNRHPIADTVHMNAAFGAAFLRQHLPRISKVA